MSTPVLVQAGLTAFDAILLVMLLVMWQINAEAVASVLRSATGTAFLIALAPLALGAFLLHRNKKAETPEHGLVWAKVAAFSVGTTCSLRGMAVPDVDHHRRRMGPAPSRVLGTGPKPPPWMHKLERWCARGRERLLVEVDETYWGARPADRA